LVTLLTLAIGIGGTTAIFGAVNAVLLRPLPYPDPDALMRLYKTTLKQPDRVGGTVSPPDFTDWRRDNTLFTEVAAYDSDSLALTGQGAAEVVRIGEVTGGFFTILGTPPLYGRTIATQDDAMGARRRWSSVMPSGFAVSDRIRRSSDRPFKRMASRVK
jgi:putative ABC transport system permease protein